VTSSRSIKPPLAVIAGPTASGKSALALARAEAKGGIVINADASQVYRDLPILSAQPTPAELARAPHRLYGTIDGAEACSAARWAALATAEIEAAWAAGATPILVGGTGLYLRTLLDGIAPVPAIAPAVRETVRALSTPALRAALEAEDPLGAARLHPNDRQRQARALEVVRSTGRSLVHWQAVSAGGLAPRIMLEACVVEADRAALHARADARAAAMLEGGALAEVDALLARGLPPGLPVLKTLGVAPLTALIEGRIDRAGALVRLQLETRQYAKRQETWLRNQWPHWPRMKLW
jgi:tRNA dimethylallyltransferase